MRNNEATIKSGIGLFDAPRDAAMTYDTSLEFLMMHCTHPELFQDIRNLINTAYEEDVAWRRRLLPGKKMPALFTQVRVFDAHKVALIKVGIIMPNFLGVWNNIHWINDIYLNITQEGLVTDIVDKSPNMNPSNGRPVVPTKW